MQSVTVCPFRVVDEINQGMDVINERKVFVLLSAAAGRQVTPLSSVALARRALSCFCCMPMYSQAHDLFRAGMQPAWPCIAHLQG